MPNINYITKMDFLLVREVVLRFQAMTNDLPPSTAIATVCKIQTGRILSQGCRKYAQNAGLQIITETMYFIFRSVHF